MACAACWPLRSAQQCCLPPCTRTRPRSQPPPYEDEECPPYEGADADELPPLSQLGDPGAAPDWPGTPSGGCRSAAPSQQAQAQQRRREMGPAANIINGRWQAPSREEADRMLAMEMGPDEGV